MPRSINILLAVVIIAIPAASASAFTFMPSTSGSSTPADTDTELNYYISEEPDLTSYPGTDASIGGGESLGEGTAVPTVAPEPTTLILFGLGLAGLIALRIRPCTA